MKEKWVTLSVMIHAIERKNKKSFLTSVRKAAHGKGDRFYSELGEQHGVNAQFQKGASPSSSSNKKKIKNNGDGPTGVFWEGRNLEGKKKSENGVTYVRLNGQWQRAPTRLCIVS